MNARCLVQHGVDVAMPVSGAKALAKFDRLVDDDPVWNVWTRHQLPETEIEDRVLDGIEPRWIDVGMKTQLHVELRRFVADGSQRHAEELGIGAFECRISAELPMQLLPGLGTHLPLVERLDEEPACGAACPR